MLRTASSLPPKGLSTLGSGPARFQTTPPACYRASWQLPGPDFHRQATTSLRTRRHTMAYVTASPPVLLGARKRLIDGTPLISHQDRRSGQIRPSPGLATRPRAPGARPRGGGCACRLRAPALSRAVGRRDLPRDGQFELFDALASTDKQLIARPGPHAQTHPDDQTSWQDFIRLNTPRVTR